MKSICTLWNNNKRFILFIFLMLFFRSAIADWYHVPSGSMQPTILVGDRVWVDKLAYDVKIPFTEINLNRHSEPQRGDVIVFNSKVSENRLIKRVIGLPGDWIEMRDNQLVINHRQVTTEMIEEPASFDRFLGDRDIASYRTEFFENNDSVSFRTSAHVIRVSLQGASYLSSFEPQQVPHDHLWVMGDNRDNSADSRVIGMVPRTELVGKANKVVISFDKRNYYLPRQARYLRTL
ncbi:MAG: signal peptidase I [Kangiellaceae bacterium]|nr:signal peptidase I [Kangiellaceae bacterium]